MNRQSDPRQEPLGRGASSHRDIAFEVSMHKQADGCLVSYCQPSPGVSMAAFLRHAAGMERCYWEDGQRDVAFAGFGVTASLIAWGDARFQEIRHQAGDLFRNAVQFNSDQTLAGPRLFGGFAFRDDFAPDNTWAVFHPAHFILPHYQLTRVGEGSWLTINALLPPEENPQNSFSQLQEAWQARYRLLLQMAEAPQPAAGTLTPVQLNYPMSYQTWADKIQGATRHMGSSPLKKVVLSRVCEIRFRERVIVDDALDYLNSQYANSYRFLFEPRPYHAFYGATPELLAEVTGQAMETMALAGSIRRGGTPAEDDALARQLLNDPKERYEHQLVVEAIRRRLSPLTDELDIPEQPGIYRLSNIQHLYTPVRACLKEARGVLPLVKALHPTPALGGSPRDLAMAFISQAEPVPRGWYAAPVGWIDHKLDGAFGVAIRSAISQERRVWLYAGAGIVADSQPQKEWDETGLKFKPMLNALNLDLGEGGI